MKIDLSGDVSLSHAPATRFSVDDVIRFDLIPKYIVEVVDCTSLIESTHRRDKRDMRDKRDKRERLFVRFMLDDDAIFVCCCYQSE